jgi:hypothetical protein
MKKATVAFYVIVSMLAVCMCSWSGAEDKDVNAAKINTAVESAKAWLLLVDSEKYGESWENSAGVFRNSVTKEKWEQMMLDIRKSLGKAVSRELKGSEYKTSLPGAPDGEYVVIQFSTSFENKKSSVETITPMLEKDGTWKVAGYYIN